MIKRYFAPFAAALVFITMLAPLSPAQATSKDMHHVVIHVNENSKARMNMALTNAANIDAYYKEKGEEVLVEIVTYGPGLHMLRSDTSPVKARIKSFGQNFDNISFKACGNTMKKMSKKGTFTLLSEAEPIPAGVIWMMERQEQGWSYIRP
jgi:hypothetical protein